MKKLLLLLLIAPVLGFGQVPDGLELVNIVPINTNDYLNENNSNPQNTLTVPNGKYWIIRTLHYDSDEGDSKIYLKLPIDLSEYSNQFIEMPTLNKVSTYGNYADNLSISRHNSLPFFIPPGTILHFGRYTKDSAKYAARMIYEFAPTNSNNFNGTLANNEIQLLNDNKPTLYPNPTSSLLALNSDKDYDIEVYDMAGNKVMALTGNTIDMSHLSSATYIVKALDKVENEEVSYKVVKN